MMVIIHSIVKPLEHIWQSHLPMHHKTLIVSEALCLAQRPAQLTTYETQPSFSVAAGALSFTDSRID